MTLDLLDPRTEPRRPAPLPQEPAQIAARPKPPALPPEPGALAAHAPSPAWAAPSFDDIACARVAEAVACTDAPAARVARTLCVMVRAALDHPAEMGDLLRGFADAAVARTIHRDIVDGWALGDFSAREPEAASLAALGVVEIAVQRALDRGPEAATPLITRELAFGLLRALGLPDSVAGAHARDAALEILHPGH